MRQRRTEPREPPDDESRSGGPSGPEAAPRAEPPGTDRYVATKGDEGAVSPSFEVPWVVRSYAYPDRAHLKRALRQYVLGHDRGFDAETKRLLAEAEPGRRRPVRGGSPGEEEPPPGPETASVAPAGLESAMWTDAPAAGLRDGRFGAPVPERLSFHRGPDTWRDRLFRGRKRGEAG